MFEVDLKKCVKEALEDTVDCIQNETMTLALLDDEGNIAAHMGDLESSVIAEIIQNYVDDRL